MKRAFDESTATADELWEYYMLEYKSTNVISRYLYNRFFNTIKEMIDLLEPDIRILEVGCGPGESSRRIMSFLKKQHFEVSEYDPRLVKKLSETNPEFRVIEESVYEMKREDNSFDLVIMLEVLEHLYDVEKALGELFRVSSKYVLLSVPMEPIWRILNLIRLKYVTDFGNTPGHINHFTPGKLKKLVSKFGKVVILKKPFPWLLCMATKI
ncbi:MAG: class I SAM-dependent methyltransferase [Ignavibacteria bacterium]